MGHIPAKRVLWSQSCEFHLSFLVAVTKYVKLDKIDTLFCLFPNRFSSSLSNIICVVAFFPTTIDMKRQPLSPFVGMMWHDPSAPNWHQSIRHDCEMGDDMKKWEYKVHNGRNYGVQEMYDNKLGANITTEFIQVKYKKQMNLNFSPSFLF